MFGRSVQEVTHATSHSLAGATFTHYAAAFPDEVVRSLLASRPHNDHLCLTANLAVGCWFSGLVLEERKRTVPSANIIKVRSIRNEESNFVATPSKLSKQTKLIFAF